MCAVGGPDIRMQDLQCEACTALTAPARSRPVCTLHGPDHIVWKCHFCCGVATFFCWGSHHMCGPCHGDPNRLKRAGEGGALPPCPAGPLGAALPPGTPCALGVPHPSPGVEFALGCALCANTGTF